MERKLFIDSPTPDFELKTTCFSHGWSISPDPDEKVVVTINDKAITPFDVSRPDVEKAYPGQNAKGFMFFIDPDARTAEYRIQYRLGPILQERTLAANFDTLRDAAKRYEVRERHEKFLASVLVCARCHASADLNAMRNSTWVCAACGESYDCRGGIDLIPESYEGKADIHFDGAICSHGYDKDVEALIAGVSAKGGMVLDCGAGWRPRMRDNVITTEIVRYPTTDVVAVGEHLPFRDGAFDAVISLHVLEHVRNPFVCAAELARVLKPGGTLYAVTPYVVGVHGFPFHFFNPTPSGLRAIFDGKLTDVSVTVPPPSHALIALIDLLAVYASFYPPEFREKFRNTRMAEIIDMSRPDMMSSEFLTKFSEEGHNFVAGNYRIVGTRT